MPELPEVTTTVNGLNSTIKNQTISDVWSDYFVQTANKRNDNIKNKKFFLHFKKEIVGEKIKNTERRGKNILIHLSHGKTILIHMKMTGHLLYGKYEWDGKHWKSKEKNLRDPFNQFIHFIINFKNGKSLAFSDMRKFAKVTLFETAKNHKDLEILGPEANDKKLNWQMLKKQILKRPMGRIKNVLMDQEVLAGIGNIYSDEILWDTAIHPERKPLSLSPKDFQKILKSSRKILAHSISLGGDSMSDYRNINGERGNYQKSHKVYKRNKEKCQKKGCQGIIQRKVLGGRSAHFCPVHQK